MDTLDKMLTQSLKNDKLSSKPSDELADKLRQKMMAQSATQKTHWNSVLPLMGNKHWAWKVSVAAVLLLSFMGVKHMEQNQLPTQLADSTIINQNLDTLNFQLRDSSFVY